MRIIWNVLASVVLALIFLLAFGVLVHECGAAIPDIKSGAACQLAYNYQTLIAGILALIAAMIAVAPVVGQLSLSRLQSAIMARDVLGKRLVEAEDRRAKAAAALRTITLDLEREIYRHDPEGEAEIDAEWAHDAEHRVSALTRELRLRRESRADPAEINAELDLIVAGARTLASSLDDVTAPLREPWDDPELGLSDQQIKVAEAQAATEAAAAERAIPAMLTELGQRARTLDAAYVRVVEKMRGRIRELDDFILDEEV